MASLPTAVADTETTGGDELWHFKTGGRFYSSPTVVDSTVFARGRDEALYALEAETGAERWRFDPPHNITSSPIVTDGIVFVGDNSRYGPLYAVDAETGEELWRFLTGFVNQPSPTEVGGTIFVGGHHASSRDRKGTLYAIAVGDGRVPRSDDSASKFDYTAREFGVLGALTTLVGVPYLLNRILNQK